MSARLLSFDNDLLSLHTETDEGRPKGKISSEVLSTTPTASSYTFFSKCSQISLSDIQIFHILSLTHYSLSVTCSKSIQSAPIQWIHNETTPWIGLLDAPKGTFLPCWRKPWWRTGEILSTEPWTSKVSRSNLVHLNNHATSSKCLKKFTYYLTDHGGLDEAPGVGLGYVGL